MDNVSKVGADEGVLRSYIDGLDGRFGTNSNFSPKEFLEERVIKELKVLLHNAFVDFEAQGGGSTLFSLEQLLWLTREGWLRSFMRQLVAVQPVGSPSSLLYYVREGSSCVVPRERLERAMVEAGVDKADFNVSDLGICLDSVGMDSVGVASEIYKYHCCFYSELDFDAVKLGYASALGAEIDSYILSKMPGVSYDILCNGLNCMREDVMKELEGLYDYIVGPKRLIDMLTSHPNVRRGPFSGWDLYVIDEVLDDNTISPLVVAGKRPDSILRKPIFAPYVLLSTFRSGLPCSVTYSGLMRAGWLS